MAQGAVSSPPLWNLFGKDITVKSAELDESFDDDFHAATSSSDINAISITLNAVAAEMAAWTESNNVHICT